MLRWNAKRKRDHTCDSHESTDELLGFDSSTPCAPFPESQHCASPFFKDESISKDRKQFQHFPRDHLSLAIAQTMSKQTKNLDRKSAVIYLQVQGQQLCGETRLRLLMTREKVIGDLGRSSPLQVGQKVQRVLCMMRTWQKSSTPQ